MWEKRIVYSLPAMERIAPRANLVYKNADGKPLLADVYLPPDAKAPSPIAILIHGGLPEGIEAKDGGLFVSWGQLMAASQIAGVTFNHRMRWANGFVPASLPRASEDLADLIRFLQDNAKDFQVDAQRIGLVAFSAGGPMLAAPIREQSRAVRCMVGLYPYLGDPLVNVTDAGRYSALDAIAESRDAVPPIFLAKAGKDAPLINDSINTFVKRAREFNAPIELMTHPDGVHAFDILNDGDTSRAIIRRAMEFITSHLLYGD